MREFLSILAALFIFQAAVMPQALAEGIDLPILAGDARLSKTQKSALDYCSVFAKGAFVRATERKRFETSAAAHAAVEKEKPGEETAQETHRIIELVYAYPDKGPNEVAGIAYARCMARYADDLDGKR